MNILFLTFYYPPDLSAGSFRSISLVEQLSSKLASAHTLHVVTTKPNRYSSHSIDALGKETFKNIIIHRITVPEHKSGMISQAWVFVIYAFSAYKLALKLRPKFIIGTTGRLMTGFLTWAISRKLNVDYFIDLRDIFSETISNLFSRKNKALGFLLNFFFSYLDKLILKNAVGVNIVAEAFGDYFEVKGFDISKWSFYPNGVDEEFNNEYLLNRHKDSELKTIVYAGNIGYGQGLEKIIPKLAINLGEAFVFLIIGDGGRSKELKEKIKLLKVANVRILPPVARSKLFKYYREADILFLHLNDMPAFKRVLPSKIFEYGAIGKPIVAGISGYSENFIKDNIPYAKVFKPGDDEQGYNSFLEATTEVVQKKDVENFTKLFSRKSIMNEMSIHILKIIENSIRNKGIK
jgi:glycosyltransferase involved in cell wall biosynthesis